MPSPYNIEDIYLLPNFITVSFFFFLLEKINDEDMSEGRREDLLICCLSVLGFDRRRWCL